MKSVLNLMIMIVLEIHISNYVFNMFEHKIKKCAFSRRSAHVWNTKLLQLTELIDTLKLRGRLMATSQCSVHIFIYIYIYLTFELM